jgi:hypothetical protein
MNSQKSEMTSSRTEQSNNDHKYQRTTTDYFVALLMAMLSTATLAGASQPENSFHLSGILKKTAPVKEHNQ